MKAFIKFALKFLCLFLLTSISLQSFSQAPENWTKDQLIQPAQLAQKLKDNDTSLVIISVGPGALIPHSVTAGPAQEKENILQLKNELQKRNRDAEIVIYCGCCPFEHCPNVRPAIGLLQEMKFTNYKLLNLPHNIKADWLDKDYPRVKL
ncbi:MAG: rhodanese-like domain-containing protein [Flavisolibacter sp.]|jgi:hypothetical protein